MYILVDIGGTKTRIAGSGDLETLSEPVIYETPHTYEEVLATLVEHARAIAGGEAIKALAAGVTVRLSQDQRSALSPSNIPSWSGKNIGDDLERSLNTHVYLCNDAALVGLGEAHFGAGLGAHIMVYITISTGINGVRIVDGIVEPSAHNYSTGEQYISMNEPLLSWEKMMSGSAIIEKYGKHPRELGKEWAGWEDLARVAAFGVHNSILHWSPERVVLGGSMFNDIGIPLPRVEFYIKQIMKSPEVPEIVHSSLGDIGGLYGGLALLKQKIK